MSSAPCTIWRLIDELPRAVQRAVASPGADRVKTPRMMNQIHDRAADPKSAEQATRIGNEFLSELTKKGYKVVHARGPGLDSPER